MKESKEESIKKIGAKKEGKMEEQQAKSKESKEKEELAPVFMIYRDNDLFKKWIPKITETLRGLNRKVEIHSFPVGTEEKEIREWLNTNVDDLKDKHLALDGTSHSALWEEYDEEKTDKKYEKKITKLISADTKKSYIDSILDKAITNAPLGKDPEMLSEKSENTEESAERNLTFLIKNILENKENTPKKVYVFLPSILSHEPFSDLRDTEKYEEQKEKLFRETEDKIKQWIINGGIPADNVIVNPEIDAKRAIEEVKKVDHDGNWIISDRHFGGGKSAKELRLPIADFYEDAQKQNLVQSNPEEVERILTETLKEEFTREQEKQEE